MTFSKSSLVAAGLAGMLLAAGPAAAQDIKIGALMPMTGDLQAFGPSSMSGIELALKEINAQGGLLDGRTLTVVVGDTQTAAQTAVDAAQKLVNVDSVVAIVGALSSGNSGPVATSVTGPAGIPQVSSASTAPVLSDIDDKDFFFRTVPADSLQGVVLAQVAKAEGFENVSVLYINNDYGEGLATAFTGAFKAKGGSIAANLAYEPGNASYRGELQNAAGDGAEALVLIGYPENGVAILRQSLEGGFFDSFIFTDGMKTPDIISAIGADFMDGSIGTAPQAVADSPAAATFRSAYEAEYGELPPKPFIDTAYDAAFVLALAIEKAGSTDGAAIRDALREVSSAPGMEILPGEWEKAKAAIAAGDDIDYVGAGGAQDFDSKGDVPGTFAFWAIEGGEIVTREVLAPEM
ncbi:ABC transporter substrate-binding protein [Algihabitans sp.]|uniref:ABC transporter substrate-binding protein n=1 Tax=Algihabitans sp. TaxID=2821514 RepID=UPI003BA91F0C